MNTRKTVLISGIAGAVAIGFVFGMRFYLKSRVAKRKGEIERVNVT